MPKDTAHFGAKMQIATLPKDSKSVEVKTVSSTSDSVVIGGLTEQLFNDIADKEKGLSNLLCAVVGAANQDKFENLKYEVKNILDVKFRTSMDSFIKKFDTKFFGNITTIKDTLGSILNAVTNTAQVEGTSESGESVAVILDTSKAKNIESLIKSSNYIFDDEKSFEGLVKLKEFFTQLNELTNEEGIVTVAVQNVNNIPNLSRNLRSKMETLTEIFTMLGGMSTIDYSKIKEVTEVLDEIFVELNEKLVKINELNIEGNIDALKTKLEEIQKFYADNIAVTAATIREHSSDLEIIRESTGDVYEVAISGDIEFDRDKIEESQSNIGDIIDAIAALGLVMLIGGAIIRKHQDLIRGSLLFGATLAVFLMELMIPIYLINKIASNKTLEGNIGEIILYITAMSLIMLLGAWLGSSDKMLKGSLRFGFMLTAFLTMLMIPITMLITLSEKSEGVLKNIANINKIVITSSIIMTLGAFLIESINVKNALMFGAVLGVFIFEVISPFILFSLVARKAWSIAEEVTKLIITCSIILILGAYLMNQPGLIKKALEFGAVLGLFILETVAPLMLFALLEEKAFKTIKAVQWYIISATVIMLIGAMLVKNKEFVHNALLFGGIFMLFISETLAPILFFAMFSKLTGAMLLELAAFVGICAFVMMIGAYFITSGLWKQSLLFGALLTTFIWGVTSPFLFGGAMNITLAFESAWELGVFILACSASLMLGVYIAKHLGAALLGGAIIAAFAAGMIALINWINSSTDQVEMKNAASIMIGIGFVMLATVATIWALKKMDVDFEDLTYLAVLELIVLGEVAIIGLISKSLDKEQGKQALMIMLGVSAVMITTALSVWLIKEFNINRNDITRFAMLQSITVIELAIVLAISKGLNASQGTQALLIMLGVTAVIAANIALILWLRKVEPKRDDYLRLMMIGTITIAEIGIVLLLSRLSNKDTWQAALVMAVMTGVLLGAVYAVKLIHDSEISNGDLKKLAWIEVLIGTLGLLTLGMGALGTKFAEEMWTGLLVMGLLTTFMIGATFAASLIAKSKIEGKHLAILLGIQGILVLLGGIAIGLGALATIPATAAFFWAGLVVIGALTVFIIGLTGAAVLIAKAAQEAEKVKDPEVIGNLFQSFIGIIASIPLNPIKLTKLITKGAFITALVMSIVPAVMLITRVIKNIANLKIEELNPDGTVKSYTNMQPADFAQAAINIKTIISTLAEGILDASKYLEKIKLGTLLKTLLVVNSLGISVGSIAKGVQEYAKLMIPDEWNSEGKPTHYHMMSDEDFKNAAANIKMIITTVGGAIADIASGKDPKSAEWMNALGKEHWWQRDNKFTRVLNVSTKLGEMISAIASGISSFANWQVADAWDENGNPTHYKQMSNAYIEDAIRNIQTILEVLPQSIIELAKDPRFAELIDGRERKSPMTKTLNACMKVGGMISSIAEGIQAMANLKFISKYDENGNPIEYTALTTEMLKKAASNIVTVLSTVMNEIIKQSDKIDESPKKTKKTFDALVSVGDIISSVANGVAAMADLKFPVYDKDGNVLNYISLANGELDKVGDNIGQLISGITKALVNAYDSNKKTWKQVPQMMNDLMPITDFIGSIADSIVKIATSKYTIDGKDYYLTPDMMQEASDKLLNIITLTIDTIIDAYNKNKAELTNEVMSNIAAQVSSVIHIIDSYVSVINKYAALKKDQISKSIENIKVILGDNNHPGLLTIILNGLPDLKGDVSDISNIVSIMGKVIEINTALIEYISLAYKNKEAIESIIKSNYLEYMATILRRIINESDILAYSDIINNVVFNELNITTYFDIYKDVLNRLINDISPLYKEIDSIYNDNFSGELTITDKINTIIAGIQTTLLTGITPATGKNKFEKIINKVVDSIKNPISFINLEAQILEYKALLNTLSNLPDVSALNNIDYSKVNENIYSILFGDENNKVSMVTILSKISEVEFGKKNKVSKLESEINDFGSIVRTLIDISNGSIINDEFIKNISESINEVSKGINSIDIDDGKLNKWDREVTSLDNFVKSINTVDVSKVAQMNELMQSLDNLANHMNNLDNLTELINSNIKPLIDMLSEKVEEAKQTIETAEKIQATRQQHLDNNIKKISEMMNTPVTVNVGKLNSNGNIRAGYEKDKR